MPAGRVALAAMAALAAATACFAPGYVVLTTRDASVPDARAGTATAVTIATAVLVAVAAAATYLVGKSRTTARPRADVRGVLVGAASGALVVAVLTASFIDSVAAILIGLAAATGASTACALSAYAAHRRAGSPPSSAISRRRVRRRDIGLAAAAIGIAAVAWHAGPSAAVVVPAAVATALALGVGAAIGPVARWLGGRAVRSADEPPPGPDAAVWADMMVVGVDLASTTPPRGADGVAVELDEPPPDQARAVLADARPGARAVIAAAAYLGRRPGVDRVAALATAAVILVGTATFAWTSAYDARSDRARVELGADRVLAVAPVSASQLVNAVRAADPNGRFAMAVVKLPGGPGRPPVVAVDGSRLAAIEPRGVDSGPDGATLAALIRPGRPTPATVTGVGLQLNASATGNLGAGVRVVAMLDMPDGTTRGATFGPLREGEHVYTAAAPCPEGCTVSGFSVIADGGPTGPPAMATVSVVLRELRQSAPDRTVLGTAAFGDGARWNIDAIEPPGPGALGASEVGLVVTVPVPSGGTGIVSSSLDSAVPVAAVSGPGGPTSGAVGSFVAVRTVRSVAAPPGVPAGGLLVDLDAVIRAALASGADASNAFAPDSASSSTGATSEVWLAADTPPRIVSALADQGLDVVRSASAAGIADTLARQPSVAVARFELIVAVVAFCCAALLIGAVTRAHRGARTAARGLGLAGTAWLAGVGGAIVTRLVGPDPATSFADGWRLLPPPPLIGASALIAVAAITAVVLAGTVLAGARGAQPDRGTICPPGRRRPSPGARGAGGRSAVDGPRKVSR